MGDTWQCLETVLVAPAWERSAAAGTSWAEAMDDVNILQCRGHPIARSQWAEAESFQVQSENNNEAVSILKSHSYSSLGEFCPH